MQNYCLKYAKQVEITKTNQKNNLSFNSCKFFSVIFLVLLCIFIVISLSILQSDAIFVLITGQGQIKRDKNRYHGTYRFYVTVLSP